MRALHAAADAGVTLIDTADVYGDGRSEKVIGRFLRERSGEKFFVATKMGRRVPVEMKNYTPEAFKAWTSGVARTSASSASIWSSSTVFTRASTTARNTLPRWTSWWAQASSPTTG